MKQFEDFLQAFEQAASEPARREIEAALWKTYGVERAIYMTDLSGFSSLTQSHGIVHYLALIRRMRAIARPIIEAHGGRVVKFEADNCFAVFPAPTAAARAAIAVNLDCRAKGLMDVSGEHSIVCAGIDYGPMLSLDEEDFFGDPVNVASKLGEDIAEPGEILVTGRALEDLDGVSASIGETRRFSVGGIEVTARQLLY
ncbi:MAG: adenylate/guanylate cyclase domain-containing protein [Alphaproteobacteria bacterium]|nr:adenylate/guanylate cyclase domain-containing protein [Alphaproteobacteria bacterium]